MGALSQLLFVSLLALNAHAQRPSADLEELAGRNTEFATALYRKIASYSDDNLVISPLSVTIGLAALAEGARSTTSKALLSGLALAPMERDGQPERIPQLLQQLRETVTQTQATGLFLAQQFQVDPEFSGQVKKYYDADVRSVDFGNAQTTKGIINDYVRSATGDKVRDFVDSIDPQIKLALISAAYFRGPWKLPFNASFTSDERFYIDKYHIVQVPMMFRSDKYYLAYDAKFKVGILRLPCTDGTAMLVLYPDEDVDYTSIDEAITAEVFVGWVEKLKKTKLEVQLPKFVLEQSYSLKRSLESIGIKGVFESTADLSGVSKSQGLQLAEVLHKVSIEVDERGASGGAVLEKSPIMASLPPRLTINRPFLFLVYHEATKALLYMGRVTDPTKK
ncbi:serpin peptidase inhibitor, clade A (alpha-1 antiproteinase, antitrypsin), member 10a [Chanos chanos]|uniref:Protein Z-dependent protease inhibitor-like n=1 Tax=Chanos chanos TaxID=29144 RepID=A0A6J2V5N0_CHACN|nr:protein Z-dependent protease inhibitor-like [Chanos chanos]XP_030626508.1 protein Z-dependent protease inhibitor-like [Chanos chanos]XP_030626509.1 protein Z-dependent protease inhibitor-like [Chanos chanos]XP_030626510.1 protein Z-dependent protease inhibitor-like [Chanos chanos]XP_030626511.1 protein Z-dependent protease inhibitor-like [Chanos chanos]XP_030626512.1 protein Z-dependent protease inhibitor-like [Chanos chanos]